MRDAVGSLLEWFLSYSELIGLCVRANAESGKGRPMSRVGSMLRGRCKRCGRRCLTICGSLIFLGVVSGSDSSGGNAPGTGGI